jgi:2-hydroxy-4-carboxymuconate semialdehyde hemiacetal dehydrogenase
MKIVLAGEGAIARKHMAGLQRIDGVEVVSLAGGNPDDTAEFAAEFGIPHHTLDLAESLAQPGVEAAILTTPTQLHANQAIQVMEADKHVLVEIPMADNLADSEAVVASQERTGVTAMVCHTRRFNPSHQWIHQRVQRGELRLQHLVVETFFFRRENKNAKGQSRAPGPTTCCGTTRATPSTCSATRPARCRPRCGPRRDPTTPSSASPWT